ncbi:LOW QUALITY PROTEIN: hypothetical protein HID58_084619 [Brassica napus]|uniref:Uncharacterized protein n=1 Tax=Brassica napus TaxID=3708 RepID=A0ABQ7XK79_BRANA|nr:LOW QUALITY PROTEIN: hypothetical protein HID58_084619 [Brassica napus]
MEESSVRNKRRVQVSSKKRKMMSELEERECSAFAPSHAARLYDEEWKIRAKHAKKKRGFEAGAGVEFDKESVDATRTFCGDLYNPLLVVPLQRAPKHFLCAGFIKLMKMRSWKEC